MHKHTKLVQLILLLGLTYSCRKVERTEEAVDYPAAYVVNGESASISIINTDTKALVETSDFKKGTWPHHISSNSDGSKLLVSLTGVDFSGGHAGHGGGDQSYIAVLESKNLKVVEYIKTDHAAHNAIFVKNDTEIWIPQVSEPGEIIRVDANSFKELGRITVGNGPLELTQNAAGTEAYACNGSANTVSIVDIASASVVSTLTTGAEPVGAWPASNGNMYIDCEVSKEIYELNVASKSFTDTLSLSYTPAYVAYNSTNHQLWVSDTQNGGIWYYSESGGSWLEMGFIATGSGAHAIAFTPDEKWAFVTNQNAGTVSVINTITFETGTINVGSKPNGVLILN